MYIQEMKVIDLNHSDYDKDGSDLHTGVVVFKEGGKRYASWKDAGTRPPWAFGWCRFVASNNYQDLSDWNVKYGYTPVIIEDGYWPEGLPADADGKFKTGDVIFVKTPLARYIKRRKHEIEMSENAPKKIQAQWATEAKSAGMDLDESLIRSLG